MHIFFRMGVNKQGFFSILAAILACLSTNLSVSLM